METMVDARYDGTLAEAIIDHDERILEALLSHRLRSRVTEMAFRGGAPRTVAAERDAASELQGERLGMTLMGLMAQGRTYAAYEDDPMDLVASLDRCGVLESLLDTERMEGIEMGEAQALCRVSALVRELRKANREPELEAALEDPGRLEALLGEFDLD